MSEFNASLSATISLDLTKLSTALIAAVESTKISLNSPDDLLALINQPPATLTMIEVPHALTTSEPRFNPKTGEPAKPAVTTILDAGTYFFQGQTLSPSPVTALICALLAAWEEAVICTNPVMANERHLMDFIDDLSEATHYAEHFLVLDSGNDIANDDSNKTEGHGILQVHAYQAWEDTSIPVEIKALEDALAAVTAKGQELLAAVPNLNFTLPQASIDLRTTG